MDTPFSHRGSHRPSPGQPLRLLPGEAHGLQPRRGLRLRVLEGRVWLTQTGRAMDCFLAAGDELVLAPQGRVVVEADGMPALWCVVPNRRPGWGLALLRGPVVAVAALRASAARVAGPRPPSRLPGAGMHRPAHPD